MNKNIKLIALVLVFAASSYASAKFYQIYLAEKAEEEAMNNIDKTYINTSLKLNISTSTEGEKSGI